MALTNQRKSNKNYGYTGSKTFNLQDYRSLQKEVKIANQRIARIEARYGEGAWAVHDLYGKLDYISNKAITPFGRVKISKDMSTAQLNLVRRSVKDFLYKSKTSSLVGIRQAKQNMIDGLQKTLSATQEVELSDKEIQALYRLVEDKDTRGTVEKVGASDLWKLLIDAREKNIKQTDFMAKVKKYYNYSNDLDAKETLKEFYNTYVKNL